MSQVFTFKYTLPTEEPISIIEKQQGEGTLLLGNLDCLRNPQILQMHQISHVISICTEEKIKLGSKFQQLFIDLHDNMETRISDVFEKSSKFISQALKLQKNVLVHCAAGISRSSTLVIAYMMGTQKILLEQALKKVKQRRPFVRPNPGFLKQLLEFERKLFGSIKSTLTSELTPFDVQRDEKYAPQRVRSEYQSHQHQHTHAQSVPIRQVKGKSIIQRQQHNRLNSTQTLTKVAQSHASIQPRAFNI